MAVLLVLLVATAAAARLGDLARRDSGDIFTLTDGECTASLCADHGAGAEVSGGVSSGGASGECACACPQRAPLFREDRELCVDDIHECSLASFGTGSGVQRIPFIYLPLKGQIIHPSKEITFQNVKTPICAVSGAQFLTRNGFLDLRNTLDADVPFNLFRDEGRTFLQWNGEDEARSRMSGRVMVVRLLCRDVTAEPASPLDLRGVFTPCVAFRVQGTPLKPYSNVTEVQFASNAHRAGSSNTSGLSVTEYVAIGISSLLLGLIYVASVFLFLHIRKRRKAMLDEDSRKLKGLKNKDGSTILERDIVHVSNERIQLMPNSMGQDDVGVKKNPMININCQYLESKSYSNDAGNYVSDSEDFIECVRDEDMLNNQTVSAIIHQHHSDMKIKNDISEINHRDESSIERLPDEHVSIVETTDDREIARPVGTTRRKLYFNPAYFEPQLMAEPPAAALEFLVKIREVISVAKHKMEAKRFQPVLNEIPEEEIYPSNGNSLDLYQALGSQRSGSGISLKRENSRKKNCVGCPGCKTDDNDIKQITTYSIPACSNCNNSKGDKQKSIRKWLENVPTANESPTLNDFLPISHDSLTESPLSLPVTEGRRILKEQKSFKSINFMYLTDINSEPKISSTLSVRSNPVTRNLPSDFEKIYQHDYNYCSQTVARIDDIRRIDLTNCRFGSLRKLENQRKVIPFSFNKNSLPDMVNEAIALDNCSKTYQSSSDEERFNNIKPNDIVQRFYARNTSESPTGNDYETDSLERSLHKKEELTPTDTPEVPSSQASPSLSIALPLEEELTMRNAVYKVSSNNNSITPPSPRQKTIDRSHFETIEKKNHDLSVRTQKSFKESNDYSLVSEVYVNNNYEFGSAPTSPSGSDSSMGSRKLTSNIKDSEEKSGCLTIEVKDSPENYIKIHESDGFEPDTLDRKNPKHKEVFDNTQFSRKDILKNIESSTCEQQIQLESSDIFNKFKFDDKVEYKSKFSSLKNENEQTNIYESPILSAEINNEAKILEETIEDNWHETEDWSTEEGRILTLELRHSKRQRQCTPPTIKQMKALARPDILPPLPPAEDDPIYEQPTHPPQKVGIDDVLNSELYSKNLSGRSLSPRTFIKDKTIESIPYIIPNASELYGPSSSPSRASVPSQSSEYKNMEPGIRKVGDMRNNFIRRRSGSNNNINSDTFVKGSKLDSKRFRRKKGCNIQDSGYLSSDSTSSRQMQRKIVIAKIVSCSDSDDTGNEARSESGAESIETHSVYFDSFRKQAGSENNGNFTSKSFRDSSRKSKRSNDYI